MPNELPTNFIDTKIFNFDRFENFKISVKNYSNPVIQITIDDTVNVYIWAMDMTVAEVMEKLLHAVQNADVDTENDEEK